MPTQHADMTREIVRLVWALDGKSGEPRGKARKKIARQLRNLKARPVDIRSATQAVYLRSLRFIEAVTANSGRDLNHLAKIDPAQRYAHLKKPWKGRAGREAALQAAARRKAGRQAIGLPRDAAPAFDHAARVPGVAARVTRTAARTVT